MDLVSFLLGIGAVLIVALVIVGVVALVKVLKLEKLVKNEVSNMYQITSRIETDMTREIENVRQQIEKEVTELDKSVDSRTDKASDRLMRTLENMKNKFPELIK